MRKFTSFMLMLLCAVATWAGPTDLPKITTDLENPIYYTIMNTRSSQPGGLMYYAGDNVGLKDGFNGLVLEDKYKFYFTGSYDALYVHNAATSNKLASVSSWSKEGTVWAVGVSPQGGGLAFGPQGGLNGNSCWNEKNYATSADQSDFTTWSANDAGSIFVVDLASDIVFPETGKFYTIEAPLFENVQGVAKGLYVDGSNVNWNTVDLTNKNFYWVPTIKEDGTIALKNLGTEKYMAIGAASDEETVATVNYLYNGQFNIKFNGSTMHANAHSNGNGASGSTVSWGGSVGTASAWKFVERRDPDAATEVTVRYSFKYNGEEKVSQETVTLVDEEYPSITVTFPYGIVTPTKPEGTISADDVVDGVVTKVIELSTNLPFVPATSYDEINTWYYLKFHATQGNFLYYDGTTNVLDANTTTVNNDDRAAFMWAFIGNPFIGYTVVNKKAGEANVLNATEAGAAFGTEAHRFQMSASSYGTNGFFMQSTNSDYKNRFNKQGGKVVYWNNADAGSTFMVEESEAALKALVDEFKTYALSGLGYVGGYTADKATEIEAISTYDGMREFMNTNSVIDFEEGAYYRIQNTFRKTFISVVNGERVLRDEDKANVSQLWQVEKATDGYRIFSPNAGYMQAVGTNALVAENGAEFSITSFKEGAGQYGIKTGNDMLAGINSTTLGTWWNGGIDGDMSYRFIATNDIAVNVNEFASLYLPFAVEVPEGLTAYAVVSTDEYAAVEAKDDIAANEGVILEGNGTFSLKIKNEATSDWSNNLLEGTKVATTITLAANETYYILGKGSNGIGLYQPALEEAEGTAFLNNANKAYLKIVSENVAQAAKYFSFSFGEGTTGIEGIEAEGANNGKIYDITGREVKAITAPGLYIINGKKVVVK